jgi:hypothetical protein
MSWQTVAAVWGAGLSSLLALSKLVPKFPLVFLTAPERDEIETAMLSVRNLSTRTLFIAGNWQFSCPTLDLIEEYPLDRNDEIARAFAEHDGQHQRRPALRIGNRTWVIRGSTPHLYVPPERTALVRVSGVKEGSERLIVLWCYRNWLIPLWLPICVRIPSELTELVTRKKP